MLDLNKIKEFDKSKMIEVYEKWPELAKKAFNTDYRILKIENVTHIVFTGMGGSGALGDIFEAMLSKTNVHVSVIKGYLLPETIDEKTLIVITSVSGETVETIKVLEKAEKTKAKVICFASGGRCEKICKEKNIEFYKIEKIHSPRASFVSFFFSMLNVLQLVISLKKEDVDEAINELEKIKHKIFTNNLTSTNPALKLAENISKIPVIYYPHGLQAAAIRFKNSLQENTKIHVIAEDVVEASHNGVVAWEKISHARPILIQGKDDYIKTKERWSIFKEYFSFNNIEYDEVMVESNSILSKIVYLIYFLDFVSIYAAIIGETDPSPVTSIEFIKKRL